MFERFTDDAREVVVQAQAEARALGHHYIGTEHLLLGAAATDGDTARVLTAHGATVDALRAAIREEIGDSRLDAAALATLGIDLDEIRRRVEATFGEGALERRRPARAGHIPFTPRSKKALELALREALAMGEKHIGAEHVVLGALRDEKALARCILRRAGADPERIREALSPAGSRRGRGG
jgi:ATP-dependent Clp protease ATP-binding subunit ClpA